MKNVILLLIVLFFSTFSISVKGQDPKEQKIKTEVSEATVFINGAQILRKKNISLPLGRSTVKFTDLSPYIDAKSVQIKLSGQAMVLGVNYQTNTEEAIKKISSEKENEINKRSEQVANQLVIERTKQGLLKDEISFLEENKKIGGANNGVSLATLRETANYYRERMSALSMQEIELAKKVKDLELEQALLRNMTSLEPNEKPSPKGEVVVEIETKQATSVNVELTYYVKNAGWFPSYDIRATSIDKPVDLLYKANIQQNTKEDWSNVKLSVSSANPNLGNVAPKLRTYYLDYNIAPPRYDTNLDDNEVKGLVYDENGEPLIGVSISVKGTTVGTVSDIDGKFSLAIPNNAKEFEISYIGYMKETRSISRQFMNIQMKPDNAMLSEVVVSGYATRGASNINKELQGKVAGVAISSGNTSPTPKREDIAMPTMVVENQTAVEFQVKIPYTIKSGNKNTVVEVERYALPAEYEYYAIPKVSKEAFLLANVSDWNKYNLLEGEANIFFENTYIGKTILDTRNVSDTLSISLGRDKGIQISRENVKDNSSKKFLSNKREESREWKINIRNNKNQAINFTVLDQVPVSRRDEIEVNIEDISGGSQNTETGEVKWNLKIKPSDKKELKLKYKVKYPNNRSLYIE